MVGISATLELNERVARRLAAGEPILHLGFGEAGLPVLPALREVMSAGAVRNSYGPVAGRQATRDAAAGWFTRRGIDTEASQVIFAPGSKALLYAALAAIPGDLVLPVPSWVSYRAQAQLLGKKVIEVPAPPGMGGIPDPTMLEATLVTALKKGLSPRILLVTVPDNPTGTIAHAEQLRQIAGIAEQFDLAIVSDEIYADLVHSGDRPPSIAAECPDRTVITTGLSKSLALGGWRIGFTRVPDSPWGRSLYDDLGGIASEIWSCLAAPQEEVARFVLDDPLEVRRHIQASALLHGRVAHAVHREFELGGTLTPHPTAGFYMYPDFEPFREVLADVGVASAADLAEVLLDRFGVAVLPGSAFGDSDRRLRIRAATSLMYGSTEQERWAALAADNPVELPWIAGALRQLGAALDGIWQLVPSSHEPRV